MKTYKQATSKTGKKATSIYLNQDFPLLKFVCLNNKIKILCYFQILWGGMVKSDKRKRKLYTKLEQIT